MRTPAIIGLILAVSVTVTACGTPGTTPTITETSSTTEQTLPATGDQSALSDDNTVLLGKEFESGDDTYGIVGITLSTVKRIDSCQGPIGTETPRDGNVFILIEGEIDAGKDGGVGPTVRFYDENGQHLPNRFPSCKDGKNSWELTFLESGDTKKITEVFEVSDTVSEVRFDGRPYAPQTM